MRRSSTTVSGPARVRLRRYGEKLLQNSSDNTKPRAPATIRMIPTVLMLNPEALTFTAKVKTAPITNRKMLTPRLKAARLLQDASTVARWPGPACMGYLVRPCTRHCCYGFRHQGKEESARLDAVHTRTAYSDQLYRRRAVSTCCQAAIIRRPALRAEVVGLRPPAPEGFLPARSRAGLQPCS
jgi:hypothetical protein